MHSHLIRTLGRATFLLLLSIACGTAILAQSVTAGLLGTVTDPQGAVIAGAQVTLTEPATGATKTVVTDASGNYSFQEIKPGTYHVKIAKDGFTSFVADNVLIENLQNRRIDTALRLGGAAETVTIQAGAAQITTEGGTISSSFDKRRVADNPSIDTYPSPYSLFTTLPGVQGNGWDLKVAGQNTAQQTIGLDGVINDRHGEQNNNINFYEEATITTVNATADNARVVNYNLVSKRGQNQFHGMAYYKRFDSNFNANDTFRNTEGLPKVYQVQHEAQAELSGPIWKNKTFFYVSWFYHRIPTGNPRNALVPDAKLKEGDFSGTPVIIIDPRTGSPFPGNIIPADRISSVSKKFQEYYPAPNGAIGGSAAHFWVHPFADDYFRASFPFIRIDHQFSDKNSLYGKWTQRKTPYVLDYDNLPGFYWTRLRDHSQFSVTDNHVFRSYLVNSFTFGLSRDFIEDGTETAKGYPMMDGNEVIANTGIQGMNPGSLEGAGFPRVDITGFRSLAVAVAGGVKNNDKTYSFEDNVTWTSGKHTFKFGGTYVRFKTFTGEVPNYGTVSFNGFATRVPGQDVTRYHAYADFLLGIPRTSSRVSPRIDREREINELGLFFTDSLKFSKHLTLDLGLRWDYYGLAKYKDGLQYNFDPATGHLIIPTGTLGEVDPRYPSSVNIVEGQVVPNADKGNFRPRIAAAYRFTDDFVLRAGYGAFTERFSRFYTEFALGGGPFATSGESFTNSITGGVPRFSFPNPFLSDSSGRSPLGARTVSGVPLDNDDGIIHQFNASIEKEFFGLGWRASYIGSRGTGLRAFVQLNAQPIQADPTADDRPLPYPQFARNGVSYVRDGFASSYNAIQFQINRRRGDFTFDAHYTYAINKNNILNSPNPFEPDEQWANDANNRRHLAVITTGWLLPVGRGRKFLSDAPGVLDAILGGWRLQSVSYFGSGFYVTPYSCNNSGNIGLYGGDCYRPDQNGDPMKNALKTVDQWFDPTVYSDPEPGTYGNAIANSIEGPPLGTHHLSLAKTFTIKERFRITFTAAFSNIFNSPNYANPDSDVYWDPDYSGQRIYSTTGNGGGAPENAGNRVGSLKLRFEF